MKPEKIPEDWVRCPICKNRYAFIRCRISRWDENNVRYERCALCDEGPKQKDTPSGASSSR